MLRAATFAVTLLLVAPAIARADAGDIIVKRVAGLSGAEHARIRSDAGVELVAALPVARTELVTPADGDRATALRELDADPDVVYAEPDRRVRVSTNDPYWFQLWNLSNGLSGPDIDAPEAWS